MSARKGLLFIFFFSFFTLAHADAPTLAGHWEGKITLQPGAELGVLIDFTKQEDGTWKGAVDIPLQNAKGLPLTNISLKGSQAQFEIVGPPGNPTFQGTFSQDGNGISGKFTQAGQTFPFELNRGTPQKPEKKNKTEAEVLNEIRDRIKTTMPDWHIPGLAVAIVKNGKVIMAEGFGVRDLESKQPVTSSTLFAIGSSTKAFTAALMGIAVDEGKLKWDDPVRNFLPTFHLHDAFATEHMTARDLLTHRSGLPRHDVVWYGSSLTRKELFDRLQYLEPNEEFRATFQYQNLMFMTAGYLEEQLEGKPWETLVKEKILDPLGMSQTDVSVAEAQKTSDFAFPFEYKRDVVADSKGKKEWRVHKMPFRNIDAVGPAGSINSNAIDMARWVQMNLNDGTLDGKTILSKPQMEEIHSPQIVVRGGIFSELLSFPEAPYTMYGMGWFIQPYRGHRLIHHGGNIDGFSAMVAFMPDDNVGLVILTNLDGTLIVDSLMFEVFDRLLGLDPIDWNSRYRLKWVGIQQVVENSNAKEDEVYRKQGTQLSHPLQDFAGEFVNAAYGTLRIELTGNLLKASLHGLESPLEHFHYDIFRGTSDQMEGMKLTFLTNLRGDIDRVSLPLEPSVAEIVFTRVPPESMRDPKFLQQFTGNYELLGLNISVELKNDHLTITVPGQPTYTLVPYMGTEFNLKDVKGYSVKFTVTNGKVTEAVFIQPNGVFPARKK